MVYSVCDVFVYKTFCIDNVMLSIHARALCCLFQLYSYRLFRDVDAALIVFDVRERKTFRRAISDITEAGGMTRKSWFKVVNDRCGDIPPVKILGKQRYTIVIILICTL